MRQAVISRFPRLNAICHPSAVGVLLSLACLPAFAQEFEADNELLELEKAARFDSESFDALLEKLPRQGDDFVYQGVSRTADELQRQFEWDGAPISPVTSSLAVNLVDGWLDIWQEPQERALRYSVDFDSFDGDKNYELIVQSVREAADDWQQACKVCGITFKHEVEEDFYMPQPGHYVDFVIQFSDEPYFLVTSFFPSSPPSRRYIRVGRDFFSAGLEISRAGLFRHALGHILGYRHNSTGVDGCANEGSNLTATVRYDARSVMHPRCGGGGSQDYEITLPDTLSHQELYGPGVLVVDFAGRNVVRNLMQVLESMGRVADLLPYKTIVQGQRSVCDTYMTALNLPQERNDRNCKYTERFAARFNKYVGAEPGVSVPLVSVYTREQERVFAPIKGVDREIDTLVKREPNTTKFTDQNGFISVQWDEYRLEVPLGAREDLEFEVEKIWADLASDEIYFATRGGPRDLEYLNYSEFEPKQYSARCSNGIASDQDFGAYSLLLGVSDAELDSCAKTPCTGPDCPQIVLIDSGVQRHPDIAEAIPGPPLQDLTDDICRPVPLFDEAQHHGTHLAGIMVSRHKFLGIGRVAQLESINRQLHNTNSRLAEVIYGNNRTSSRPKLFVLASRFHYERGDFNLLKIRTPIPTDEDELNRALEEAERKNNSAAVDGLAPAREIRDMANKPWIVAIGSPKYSDDPIEISEDSALSPMNLGPLPNVIVVSACEDCKTVEPKLWDGANIGLDEFVPHVAAPGGIDIEGIPGVATDLRYGEAKGTSQAAAFVGGLAAAMTACHAPFKHNAPLLKTWLQVTSTPIINDKDNKHIATGVVNIKRALSSPDQSMFKTNLRLITAVGSNPAGMSNDTTNEMQIDRAQVNWCTDDIRLERGSNRWNLSTEDIYRITKATDQGSVYWVIYTQQEDLRSTGKIIKHGPGDKLRNNNRPLVKIGNRTFTLGQIDELLLSQPLWRRPQVDCRAN